MKKFMSLFVMAILIVSAVPLAFAQERAGVDGNAAPDAAPRPVLYRAGSGNGSMERPVDAPTRKEVRERIQERLETAKERFKAARERYQLARERYQEARDRYQEKRKTFNQAKDALKACKNDDSADCEQKREQAKDHAGLFLKRSADLVLKELERVKAKVESSEDLSEDEVADIVADLDDKMSEVESAKAVIDGLDENSTREDVNAAAKTIREAWQHTRTNLKQAVGKVAVSKLHNIMVQVEQLQTRFEKTKERLDAQGKDTSALESVLDDFQAQLDIAQEKYDKSKDLWDKAKDEGAVNDAAKESTALMNEAKDALVEARQLLRDAVKEVRDLNNGQLELEPADDGATEDSGEDA